jgi:regulator of replication initiation timing
MMMQYSKRPIRIKGNPKEVNDYVQTLKQTISEMEIRLSNLTQSNKLLVEERNLLQDKLDTIRKTQEMKTLANFKRKNAERKLKSEQIRTHLGHDYESDDDE